MSHNYEADSIMKIPNYEKYIGEIKLQIYSVINEHTVYLGIVVIRDWPCGWMCRGVYT